MDTTGFDDAFGTYNGPQVIYDMSAKAYHSDADGPRLSQSLATTCVTQSPLHAWQSHALLGGAPYRYMPNSDDGTIIHSLMLEPNSDDIEEIDPATIKTKDGKPSKSPFATEEGKRVRDDALAAGRIPILTDELGAYRYKAKAFVQRLSEHAERIEFTGKSEVVIYWQEETPSGVIRCRSRLDHLIVTPDELLIIDVKTCGSAHPNQLKSQVWKMAYDIQDAAYRRAVTAAFPDYAGRVRIVFAFCELDKPWAVNPITLNGEFRALGEARWIRGRDLWAKCLNADDWTGYAGGDLAPPAWAMSEEMGE